MGIVSESPLVGSTGYANQAGGANNQRMNLAQSWAIAAETSAPVPAAARPPATHRMPVWFRAMHPLAQGKKGLSNIELGRRLGISTNAAWRVQHKLMQAMIERDRRYKLGANGPRIEIDDAYIGGERTGEGAGRGRRGHTPFIIAVETSADGRPLHARLQVVRGFQAGETKRLCAYVEAGTTVVSDGGQWFRCIAAQPGLVHQRHVTGTDRAAARHPAFRW